MNTRELGRDNGPQYDLKPENTEYIEAGPITFAVEYRFLYHEDPHGQLSGVLFDQGICIHVFEGETLPEQERLRFDCLQISPHYHYDMQGRDEHVYIDTAAEGDPLRWALERIRTRLTAMLVRSGAVELARKLDQKEIDSMLPKLAAWADVLTERACTNWRGTVNLIGAKAAGEMIRAKSTHEAPPD